MICTREDFLKAVLPPLEDGEHYCVWAVKHSPEGEDEIVQRFATSHDKLLKLVDKLDAAQFNVFFALAKFGPPINGRTAVNAIALQSFFLDLDCGVGKPYATLNDGIAALSKFCKAAKLPKPTIVKSGRGAHVYWSVDAPINRSTWTAHATKLAALCVEHGLHADTSVTKDAARILRVPGTQHRKDPTNPLPVEILWASGPHATSKILEVLPAEIDVLAGVDKSQFDISSDPVMQALIKSRESSFKTIMKKSLEGTGCAQIVHIYNNQATLEEPLWRAGLSIAQVCKDRNKSIHNLSKQHPGYSYDATEEKANATKGPYTCDTFRKLNPAVCEGCALNITSPIQLGTEIAQAPDNEEVVALEPITKELKTYNIPKYPFPFFRGKNGGVFRKNKKSDDDEDEVDELIYPYDFYVVKRMQDPDMGETLFLRLHLPQDGVREFVMPLASVLSKEKFISTIASHGITVLGKKQEALMMYVAKWVEALQMDGKAEKAYKQFGWLDDESAILVGDREIRATEIVYSPPSTPTLPLTPLFQEKGDFHVWKDVINTYAREGMEARAFAFFMGFGTLLMRFTPLDGFILNLVSKESGSGKTTVLHAINSIYGRPKELLLSPKDTYNSRMQRFGVMQNLALTLDEITNMPPDQLTQQAFDATSGRGKHRLQQHSNAERLNHTKWQTGLISSANRYIIDALLSIKGFPDGELKRIIDLNIRPDTFGNATWARNHFSRLMNNYGHAITPYAQHLVAQVDQVRDILSKIQLRVDNAADVTNAERYWAMMVSISMTGGLIAGKLGLHDIPTKPVFNFAINMLRDVRRRTEDAIHEADDFLGIFLQKHFHEVLVINGDKDTKLGLDYAPIREPKGPLTIRYEPDTKLLYIMAKAFRDDCSKIMLNFEEVLAPYIKDGIVSFRRKKMTTGTVSSTHATISTLCFDTTRLSEFDDSLFTTAPNEDSGLIITG